MAVWWTDLIKFFRISIQWTVFNIEEKLGDRVPFSRIVNPEFSCTLHQMMVELLGHSGKRIYMLIHLDDHMGLNLVQNIFQPSKLCVGNLKCVGWRRIFSKRIWTSSSTVCTTHLTVDNYFWVEKKPLSEHDMFSDIFTSTSRSSWISERLFDCCMLWCSTFFNLIWIVTFDKSFLN